MFLNTIPVSRWNKTYDSIRFKFPDCPDLERIWLTEETGLYAKLTLWKECVASSYELLRKYAGHMRDREINELVWEDLFLHTDDHKVLKYALQLMKPIAENSNDISSLMEFWDTYANLLYKLGNRNEAIIWENKVIQLAIRQNSSYVGEYKTTLKKMTNGEPTWEIPAG